MSITLKVDGDATEARPEERLVDVLNRTGTKIPQVCYHPQLGPIQTCDTCMVEADGNLVRACATTVSTAPSATITTATAPFTTRPNSSPSSIRRFPSRRSRMKSITQTRF